MSMSQMMAQMGPALEAMMTRMVQGVEDRLTHRFGTGTAGPTAPQTAVDPVQPVAATGQTPRDMLQMIDGARRLGCQTFAGVADPESARRWLKSLTAAVVDLGLGDTDRIRLAGRLLEGEAEIWLMVC